MDEGAWWASVHGVTKSQIQLSDLSFFLDPRQDHLVPHAHSPSSWLLVHSHIL